MIGIYKITSPSNRLYVGQSINIEKRWKGYSYKNYWKCQGQTKLLRSFIKHGVENHKFDILEVCKIEDLNDREIYWGLFYNALGKDNLTLKLGNSRCIISEETKQKISIGNLGKIKHSEQNKIDQSNRALGNKNNLGKTRTNQTKELQSKSHLGKKDSDETKLNKSNSAKGKTKTKEHRQHISDSHPTKKPVIKMTLQEEYIEEYISINEAFRQTGVRVADISACCNNKQKTAKGFKWKFKNE